MAIRIKLSTYKSVESQEDCYVLLYNGYILENITGGIVVINGCKQVVVQRNKYIKRKLPYKFNHPQYWYVVNDKGIPIDVEITTLMRIKAKIKQLFCKIF